MIKKILVFGAGYVGSSLGILLSQNFQTILIDNDMDKVNKINNKEAPINEPLLNEYLKKQRINICASISYEEHIYDTDLIILALPTNYDETSNYFDTSILESALVKLDKSEFTGPIIIKSTIPVGFTKNAKKAYKSLNIVFAPEFLREGNAIEDNLKPSRIIIGGNIDKTKEAVKVLQSIAIKKTKVIYMDPCEAEAVKLFANTYLATRVSFFNELDSFALEHNLNTKNIIDGISSDERIGVGYNNPSFGYGGYCLPKDSKQLLANYEDTPQEIFSAVVKSNTTRKEFISKKILEKKPDVIGVFRLIMKKNSENFRGTAIFDIIQLLEKAGKKVIVYEPLITDESNEFQIANDLDYFKETCDLILANRMDNALEDIKDKVFTRDIYGEN